MVNKYVHDDLISQEGMLARAQTGDLLLFKTDNLGAKLQRYLAKSEYDHIAMIVRLNGMVYVLDSQTDTGVAITQWNEFIFVNDLYLKAYYRQLVYEDKAVIEESLLMFIQQTMGKKYSLSIEDIIFKWKSKQDFFKKSQ